MAPPGTVRRKIDGAILSDLPNQFSDWFASYPDPTLTTVNNATYRQHFGVMEKHAIVRYTFANRYPNSSMAHYFAFVGADRLGRELEVLGYDGQWVTCFLQQPLPEPEPVEVIRTFGIFTVQARFYQAELF